eukprot:12424325-Karenia_brevis.AAC.1
MATRLRSGDSPTSYLLATATRLRLITSFATATCLRWPPQRRLACVWATRLYFLPSLVAPRHII